jgi:hypothetical protein
MSDHDARYQNLAALHERRKQVIRLHKKQYGVMQIVELTHLSWSAVRAAIDLYEAGGMAALKPKPRGKKGGEGRSLTPDQEAHIRKLIVDQRPEQLKMDFALSERLSLTMNVRFGRCRRRPADRAGIPDRVVGARRWQVSETLGLHAAKTDQEGLRAVTRGREEMDG